MNSLRSTEYLLWTQISLPAPLPSSSVFWVTLLTGGISEEINTCGWRFFFWPKINSVISPTLCKLLGFPGRAVVKNSSAKARDVGLVLDREDSPGGENDNPRQYSCLGNPVDGGAWRPTVHGIAQSRMWLSARVVGYYIQQLPPDTPVKASNFCDTLSSVLSAVGAFSLFVGLIFVSSESELYSGELASS